MIQDAGFCLKKIFFDSVIIFYMPSFPMDTFVKLILSCVFSLKGKYPDIMLQSAYFCMVGFFYVCKGLFHLGLVNTCLIAELGHWIAWLVCLHWIQSELWLKTSFSANSYKKACVDELEKEIRISKRRRYKFQLDINHLHIWPHVVMFEVVRGSRNWSELI